MHEAPLARRNSLGRALLLAISADAGGAPRAGPGATDAGHGKRPRRVPIWQRFIAPFIMQGGYSKGSSLSVLAQQSRGARIADALEMQADQERGALNRVTRFLGRRGAVR